ncbi:hypothetical protein [Flavobacterium silvaticum]|uniref:Uncharacterized protein n=1 Tax=Flavobacterium silvaticum TaxID=1852020 RepID=A0A972FJV3_9FLAO|nr:hypothetical protein [Flavobacterium silvaticum]NMH26545.1 hypothetical protein [Flavobacterium silvaticum]
MKPEEIISWIFLALGISSKNEAVGYERISQIADGINHAIPTHKEIQFSINWLISKNLVSKNDKKYSLSENGKILFSKSEIKSQILLSLWKELEHEIKLLNSDIA